jgi:hypothetical protein
VPRAWSPSDDNEPDPAFEMMCAGAGNLVDDDGCLGPLYGIGVWPLTAADDWCGEFRARS